MAFQTFNCPFCNKPVTSTSYIDVSDNERLHSLSCGHSTCEKLIAKQSHKASEITSVDGKKLRPYQIEGIEFAERANGNCLIADEPRLGKTPQALVLLKLHPEMLPCAIICKSAVKYQMAREIMRWFDMDAVADVIDKSNDLHLPRAQFYIYSYDILRRFNGKLKEFWDKRGIKTVLIDECQQIKSTVAQRTVELRKLVKDIPYKLALSGTPIKNNAAEYFSILNILKPQHFRHFNYFVREWVDSYWDGYRYKVGGLSNPEAFHNYTKDFIIRRERSEVIADLEPLDRQFQYHDLAEEVQKAYDSQEEELVKYMEFGSEGDDKFTKASNIMAYLARMRHLVGLSKIENCLEHVAEFLGGTDRKLIIFAHHKDVQEILFKRISNLSKEVNLPEPLSLNAALSNEERFEVVSKFNDGDARVLIASQLASGEGITFKNCSDLIMLERQWNPANEEQCEARPIDLEIKGQKVCATYFVALGTVDEYLTEIVEKKREIFTQTMKPGDSIKWDESSIMQELQQKLLEKGRAKWKL